MNAPLAVVIPTMGRETVVRTVQSLLDADPLPNGARPEIVVAGHIANPDVAAKIDALVTANPCVRHLDISFPTGDSSLKKNHGAAATAAPVVAFIDDDVVVERTWPAQILAPFDDPDVGLVSGPSLIPDDINRVGRLAGLALSSPAAGWVAERYRTNADAPYRVNWERIIGCNAAYRRSVFEAIGGFPADFYPGEEMIAAFRTQRAGHTLLFLPAARLRHYPRQSVARFWRQMWTYGATRIRLIRGGTDFHPASIAPAGLVFAVLALAIATIWLPLVASLALAALLALYLLFAAAIAIATALREKRAGDLLLVLAIPFMHVAYGLAEWSEFFRPGRDFSEKPR